MAELIREKFGMWTPCGQERIVNHCWWVWLLCTPLATCQQPPHCEFVNTFNVFRLRGGIKVDEERRKKERKERREEKNTSPSIWARVQPSSLECRETPFSGHLAKYLQPAVLQLNTERTSASKIDVVEHLAHKTMAHIILLQETYCTCVDKLVILKFALVWSIPCRKHGLATFVHYILSWTLAGIFPEDLMIECLCVDIACLNSSTSTNLHPLAL